jgi:hypothetical protein
VNPSGSAATPIHVNIDLANFGGDLTVDGTLDVTGDATLEGALNVTGAAIVTDTLNVGADTDLGGDLDVAGTANITGDIVAAGGFKQQIGAFYVTTAADQTAVGLKLGDTVGQAWVAPGPGSVLGTSGFVDAAVTGAGKSIKLRVYKALAADLTSFSLLNAALDLDFTQAGGERGDHATAAKDAYAFAAGDALKFVYTTDTITNTPKVTAFLMVEC